MNITGIESLAGLKDLGSVNNKTQNMEGAAFGDMLSNAIKEADDAYAVASEGTQAVLAGEVDNIAQVMIDGAKAELSLNLVIQVRNKAIEAYNEFMRMQV